MFDNANLIPKIRFRGSWCRSRSWRRPRQLRGDARLLVVNFIAGTRCAVPSGSRSRSLCRSSRRGGVCARPRVAQRALPRRRVHRRRAAPALVLPDADPLRLETRPAPTTRAPRRSSSTGQPAHAGRSRRSARRCSAGRWPAAGDVSTSACRAVLRARARRRRLHAGRRPDRGSKRDGDPPVVEPRVVDGPVDGGQAVPGPGSSARATSSDGHRSEWSKAGWRPTPGPRGELPRGRRRSSRPPSASTAPPTARSPRRARRGCGATSPARAGPRRQATRPHRLLAGSGGPRPVERSEVGAAHGERAPLDPRPDRHLQVERLVPDLREPEAVLLDEVEGEPVAARRDRRRTCDAPTASPVARLDRPRATGAAMPSQTIGLPSSSSQWYARWTPSRPRERHGGGAGVLELDARRWTRPLRGTARSSCASQRTASGQRAPAAADALHAAV